MDRVPDSLVTALVVVVFVAVSVGGTYIRQRDRRAGRELAPSWSLLAFVAVALLLVAILL
ncbi:MAG: hypothetical protein ACR2QO_09580 [Acidimicrobiales bacterium]